MILRFPFANCFIPVFLGPITISFFFLLGHFWCTIPLKFLSVNIETNGNNKRIRMNIPGQNQGVRKVWWEGEGGLFTPTGHQTIH